MRIRHIVPGLLALFVAAMLWTGVSAAQANTTPPFFTDVPGAALWAMTAIEELAAQGIVEGVSAGTYDPSGPVTEAEVLATLVRMLGLPTTGVTSAVPASTPAWAQGDVAAAIGDDLVPGFRPLAPNDSATRLWALDALVRAMGDASSAAADGSLALPYTDATAIPVAERGYVAIGTKLGIVTGFPDGSFEPDASVSRAEWAVMLQRLEMQDSRVSEPLPALETGLASVSVAAGAVTVRGQSTSADCGLPAAWVEFATTVTGGTTECTVGDGGALLLWDGVVLAPSLAPYVPAGQPVVLVGSASRPSLVLLGSFHSTAPPAAAAAEAQMAQEAERTAASVTAVFYDPSRGMWTNTQGQLGPSFTPADAWPYACGLDALEEVAALPVGKGLLTQVQTLVQNLGQYWDAAASVPAYAPTPGSGPNTNTFFDDNDWSGLDLVQAYRLTGDPQDLTQAEAVFRDEESGWDNTAGGIFWNDQRQYRNTPANAPAAELGAELYRLTGQATYLSWAEKIYAWEVQNLVNPASGAVYDGIQASGAEVHDLWTYNQGTVIGASVLLYKITHQKAYLTQAEATFAFTDQQMVQTGGVLVAQPDFNGILADNLVLLYSVDPDPAIAALLNRNAQAAWTLARNTTTGLVGANWEGPPPTGSVTLLTESGAIRLFAAAAAVDGMQAASEA